MTTTAPEPPPVREPAPGVEPGTDATWGGTVTLRRRTSAVVADLALIGVGPFAAAVGYAVTGGPAGLIGSGVAGAAVAVAVECTRRRHV